MKSFIEQLDNLFENKMIKASDGQEYMDIPRMRKFIEIGTKIRNRLPELQNGYIRLWRGNRPGELGKNPSYTNSLEGIALPFLF